ncbi:peptidase inhibitor family I36 protein [Streptomyces sp. NPDC057428]|uniref:peptidase inhibitor family I36 protein n=1 Tax=Streptomyces sp. NPDC057428 TaxID=3346129 RepID=UPI0036B6AB8C
MHRFGRKRAAVAVASAAAAMFLGAAPAMASAASGPVLVDDRDPRCATAGHMCVFGTEWFTGPAALYEGVDAGCVTAPFGILAVINMTDKPVTFYKNADCTGGSVTEPAGSLHSWKSLGPMLSFRS